MLGPRTGSDGDDARPQTLSRPSHRRRGALRRLVPVGVAVLGNDPRPGARPTRATERLPHCCDRDRGRFGVRDDRQVRRRPRTLPERKTACPSARSLRAAGSRRSSGGNARRRSLRVAGPAGPRPRDGRRPRRLSTPFGRRSAGRFRGTSASTRQRAAAARPAPSTARGAPTFL